MRFRGRESSTFLSSTPIDDSEQSDHMINAHSHLQTNDDNAPTEQY